MIMQTIPLHQLRLSPRNARKTGGTDIDALAASIAAHGLLQNLTVTIPADGGFDGAEVVAGGRRLAALQLLASRGEIVDDYSVPVCIVADASALEASTAENTVREPMHPADQFTAFKGMVDAGEPIDDVAAHFGVSERIVRQRLKLANVDPQLVQIYRDDHMSLEQLHALALTDDHDAQRKAWFGVRQDYERQAYQLRDAITKTDVRADSGLAKFVGIDAYEAAGGTIRRDLFSERDEAWLCDRQLLDSLVRAKLEQLAQVERDAGWSWVETHLALDYQQLADYPAYAHSGDPVFSTDQHARVLAIEARMREIENSSEDEGADDDALNEEFADLEDELHAINDAAKTWPDGTKEKTGVLIFLSHNDLRIERARLQPGQKPGKNGTIAGTPDTDKPIKAKPKPEHSDALLQTLSAHRSEVARCDVMNDPALALALIVDWLMAAALNKHDDAQLLSMSATSVRDARGVAQDIGKENQKPIAAAIKSYKNWSPKAGKSRLASLLEMPQQQLLNLLAIGIGMRLDGITAKPSHGGINAIQAVVGFDMADYWNPACDNYLARIPAAAVLAAVREARGNTVADNLKGLKKDALIAEAAMQLAGTGWLPKPLRGVGYALKKPGAAQPNKAKPTLKSKPKKAPAKKAGAKKKPAAKKTVNKLPATA
jgi:ParB family chromosome partitioning protein